MSTLEWVLLIGAIMAPIIAILFILPKIKKKQNKFETTDYVPEKKEEHVEIKPEVEEPIKKEKSFEIEIQNYREFLEKRKEKTSKPIRLKPNHEFDDLTESYSAMRRRKQRESQQEQSATDLHSLSPEIKAMLIAGILDRKF